MAGVEPKQLRILKALTTRLEAINPDNLDMFGAPYEWDLRGKVIRGRTAIGQEVPAPFLALLEAPKSEDTVPVGGGTKRQGPWNLLLQGFASDDRQQPTDPAYFLKAAVEERLSRIIQLDSQGKPAFPEDYRLDNLIMNATIGSGIVRPPEAGVSPTAFFYLPITVQMATDLSNPYSD